VHLRHFTIGEKGGNGMITSYKKKKEGHMDFLYKEGGKKRGASACSWGGEERGFRG